MHTQKRADPPRNNASDARRKQQKNSVHPMDIPLKATWFAAVNNPRGEPIEISLRQLAELVQETLASEKAGLPLISFMRFEGHRRGNANARRFSAICCDYDGGVVSIDDAATMVRRASVSALIHSTPSSTAAAPRWRAILPVSRELSAKRYRAMVERANYVFGGILAPESFTPSQAYFVGHIGEGRPWVHLS